MDIKYTVKSCSEHDIAVTAKVAGRDVVAKVPGLVVEMESEDGGMGHTFRFTPEDMEATKLFFAVDEAITATFTKTEEE